MKVLFSRRAWNAYVWWQSHDPQMVDRINDLIEECVRSPFRGRGKPEPLKKDLSGWWSRRISAEHRLVYRVEGKGEDQRIEIAQCRFH